MTDPKVIAAKLSVTQKWLLTGANVAWNPTAKGQAKAQLARKGLVVLHGEHMLFTRDGMRVRALLEAQPRLKHRKDLAADVAQR